MITAKEANDISGTKTEVFIEFIEEKIKASAKLGKHEVIIRENPYSGWLYVGYNKLHDNEKACLDELKTCGFDVDLYYNEGQFVDIGLRIKW